MLYCSYDNNSISYDLEKGRFEISINGKKAITEAYFKELIFKESKFTLSDFTSKEHSQNTSLDYHTLSITYTKPNGPIAYFTVAFTITPKGVQTQFFCDPEARLVVGGKAIWGEDCFPMSSTENSSNLRTALGPAATNADNMLFDRATDSGLSFTGAERIRLRYDWESALYSFTVTTGILAGEKKFLISAQENIMATQYGIKYSPINKKNTFKKAPSGWMTWYSVGFNACEDNVLENTKWQSENLLDYGADAIWIDWEWCHADYEGKRDDGTSDLAPDPQKYPHGLGYIANKIKDYGFIPCLWIGYTNCPSKNDYVKANPDIILAERTGWCGTYYYDFSNPKYLNEFLPMAIKQVKDWGYEAVKYDTLHDGILHHEEFHDKMYNPLLTTKEAFRNMVQKTRDLVGEDFYMLACSASRAGVLWACDIFDASRVGGDIFEWEEFMKQGIMKIMYYYPLHNIVLYTDPDNVILSEKYNTFDQAASRIYFTSLLGLPMTLGDDLPKLPPQRADLIKHCLPVMDIHPMDIKHHTHGEGVLTVQLNVELPFEAYTVLDLFNMEQTATEYELRPKNDLYLDSGLYHIYDYTKKEYLGYTGEKLRVSLNPCESRIFAIRKKLDRPQIVSTSRHITQGAAEITRMKWEDKTLSFTAKLVKDDPYTVTVYVPDTFKPIGIQAENNLLVYTVTPEKTGELDISFKFE